MDAIRMIARTIQPCGLFSLESEVINERIPACPVTFGSDWMSDHDSYAGRSSGASIQI